METNGTIKTNLNFDWITVSPKEDAKWRQRSGNELKLVYPQTKFDLKKIVKLDFNYFFFNLKMILIQELIFIRLLITVKLINRGFLVFKFINH